MQISFFEEFPTKENLKKLTLIPKKTNLFLAAKSIQEFQSTSNTTHQQYPNKIKQIVYWPILKRSEGYWISPFSNNKALQRIFKELENKTFPVMLDLELPTTQNPLLFITQLPYFIINKHQIRKFINHYQGPVYLCEYPLSSAFSISITNLLGLHYNNKHVKIMKMQYRSLHHISNQTFKNKITSNQKKYPNRFIPGIGTTATGIHQNEPILSPQNLKRDLQILKDLNIQETVIFRLGGLTKEHIKIMKSF